MPVHDWRRVDAGVFHDFHTVWIALLRIALNNGVLPEGYYAMSEQHAGRYIADVLTLHQPDKKKFSSRAPSGGLAVAESPPQIRHFHSVSSSARALRRTLTIRHATADRIVALVEIVSPANKDRPSSVRDFLNKLEDAITHGIHLLMVDLFPPGKHDRAGLNVALLKRLGDAAEAPPTKEPLTLASYVADIPIKAYFEHIAVGSSLPAMPLFLDPEIYIKTPLEETYQTAWQSTPERWREVLQRPQTQTRRKRR